MEPDIKVGRYASGELKLFLKLKKGKNVWFNGNDEATWVPEEETIYILPDVYQAINDFNMKKRKEKETEMYSKVKT